MYQLRNLLIIAAACFSVGAIVSAIKASKTTHYISAGSSAGDYKEVFKQQYVEFCNAPNRLNGIVQTKWDSKDHGTMEIRTVQLDGKKGSLKINPDTIGAKSTYFNYEITGGFFRWYQFGKLLSKYKILKLTKNRIHLFNTADSTKVYYQKIQ